MNDWAIKLEVDNGLCEAINCSSKAAIQLKVKVGQLGNMSLSLCNDCVKKFAED